MEAEPKDFDLEALLRDLSRSRAGRKKGRPSIPHREWLRAEVSRDLVTLLKREAQAREITVTALVAVVLCDRYGVQLGPDNRITDFREEAGSP